MNNQYPIRLIVAGGRKFDDDVLFEKAMWKYLVDIKATTKNTEIVEGGAEGADRKGHLFAVKYHFPTKRFEADWEKHGKGAGPRRNIEMRRYATHLLAFWDGVSAGTKHMIEEARRHNLDVEIVYYTGGLTEYISDSLKQ